MLNKLGRPLGVLSLLLAGCCIYKYQGRGGLSLKSPNRELASTYFHYTRGPLRPQVKLVGEKGPYWQFKVEFVSGQGEYRTGVTMYYYKVKKAREAGAAIVLLPIYDGIYILERILAYYLTKHGFAVLRFERSRDLLRAEKGLEYVKGAMRTTIIDIEKGIDWLISQPEIDPQRIGIMGTSFGAVLASIVTGIDPRIKAAVFFLGGGDVGLLFSRSKERMLVRFRQRIMEDYDLSLEEFRQAFSAKMAEVDPLTYAPRLDPAKILMINALWDRVVVPECTEKLWWALGRPELINLWAGHYTAPLYILYVCHRVVKHFRKTLLSPP